MGANASKPGPPGPGINKHAEFAESWRETKARADSGLGIVSRARDSYNKERGAFKLDLFYRQLESAIATMLTGGRVPVNYAGGAANRERLLAAVEQGNKAELAAWMEVIRRGNFTVPPGLIDIKFDVFWNAVIERRKQGEPCIRTLYTGFDPTCQVLFKTLVLSLTTVDWLCGQLDPKWIQNRLKYAAQHYGINLPNGSYTDDRIAYGVDNLKRANAEQLQSVFGPGGTVPPAGGTPRVTSWARYNEAHGTATWDGSDIIGERMSGGKYLPDILFSRKAGLYMIKIAQDREFGKAMSMWGACLIVGSREEYKEKLATLGSSLVYLADVESESLPA
jgi:hypothetical protein